MAEQPDREQLADRLAAASIRSDDPTGWFERLYAAAEAGEVALPWSRTEPQVLLVEWAGHRDLVGSGNRAVVVGCGLGSDAAYLAELGFNTVGFDIAETAIEIARRRFPDSTAQFVVADLLDPPAEWVGGFDLVVEIYTAQALPDPPRPTAIRNVTRMVAPGGTLVVIAFARVEGWPARQGPPWPLTRTEIDAFGADGLVPVTVDLRVDADNPVVRRWLAEFHRPSAPSDLT